MNRVSTFLQMTLSRTALSSRFFHDLRHPLYEV